MPDWLVIALLVVFVIHLVLFLRIALKRRERYYWLVSLTFLLLVISFSSRLWLSDLLIGKIPAYWFPRVAAWGCTITVIVLAIRRRKQDA
jgi:hypothetical protein